MCSQREKRTINHMNRILIAVAGITGVLTNGFQSGDLLGIVSMLLWLWQSEFNVVEEKLLDQIRRLNPSQKEKAGS
ncbi:hypothetical protein [Allohahella marinimesophila]|uniref:TMhelix containing protein n=1 Tax=Allohahella marinimesophila TaxID=1054972 RepID=A0ABP7PH60_9GAMM